MARQADHRQQGPTHAGNEVMTLASVLRRGALGWEMDFLSIVPVF